MLVRLANELTSILEKMYNIEPHKYFSDFYKFLKNKDNNRISFRKTFFYIITIFSILIIGQIIAFNSEPYKSDNIENERFINAEINSQIIIDTISLPIKQSCFKNYFAIKLKDESIYRLNLASSEFEDKITNGVKIQKKAKAKTFEILNNNKKYSFIITELSDFGTRIFFFMASLIISIVGIPLWFKKNELEKIHEKNNR